MIIDIFQSTFTHYLLASKKDICSSSIAVAMDSKDLYEIIGLHKILRSIKQPCRSVCLKKALEMHQVAETM